LHAFFLPTQLVTVVPKFGLPVAVPFVREEV